jgi:GT2 family glycosyltransferase
VKFSIVIPNSDNPGLLKRLLNSIIASGFCKSEYEVIVVENGKASSEPILAPIFERQLNLKFLWQRMDFFCAAAARNLGLRVVSNQLVIFFDSDIYLAEDTIQRHLNVHREQSCGVLGFGVRHNVVKIDSEAFIDKDDRDMSLVTSGNAWYYAYTCNLSVSFVSGKIYFDPGFMHWGSEDQEFSYRLHKQGYRLVPLEKCICYQDIHHNINSPFLREKFGLPANYKDFLLSRVYFLRKYWDDPIVKSLIIKDLAYYSLREDGSWARQLNPDSEFNLDIFLAMLLPCEEI